MPNESTVNDRNLRIRVVGEPSMILVLLKLAKLLLKIARNGIVVVTPQSRIQPSERVLGGPVAFGCSVH